jgi:hypothetical protein
MPASRAGNGRVFPIGCPPQVFASTAHDTTSPKTIHTRLPEGHQQLRQDFNVEGFMAACVVVRRKADGQRGSLMFQHAPRLFFNFQPYHE